MKVKELIEKLGSFDQSLEVLVDGYEGGFSDIGLVHEKLVKLNVNKEDYLGPHDDTSDADTKVIILGRKLSR